MKKLMILKVFILCTLLTTSCKKDDDPGCVKEENFFEAEFDGEKIEPFYNQGGGFGLYTLSLQRCFEKNDSWRLSCATKSGVALFISLMDVTQVGSYPISAGDPEHVAIDCAVENSLFVMDVATYSYSFISSNDGVIEITEYDNGIGKMVGTFTAEMVSTTDPSVKKTITGRFNLNKSTLDNTRKPCWL